MLACASLLAACSSPSTVIACGVAGRERSCPCVSANTIGLQSCQLDGRWGACTCYPLASGGSASVQIASARVGAGTSDATAGTHGTHDASAASANGSAPQLMP